MAEGLSSHSLPPVTALNPSFRGDINFKGTGKQPVSSKVSKPCSLLGMDNVAQAQFIQFQSDNTAGGGSPDFGCLVKSDGGAQKLFLWELRGNYTSVREYLGSFSSALVSGAATKMTQHNFSRHIVKSASTPGNSEEQLFTQDTSNPDLHYLGALELNSGVDMRSFGEKLEKVKVVPQVERRGSTASDESGYVGSPSRLRRTVPDSAVSAAAKEPSLRPPSAKPGVRMDATGTRAFFGCLTDAFQQDENGDFVGSYVTNVLGPDGRLCQVDADFRTPRDPLSMEEHPNGSFST